jgi:hypothetical protein
MVHGRLLLLGEEVLWPGGMESNQSMRYYILLHSPTDKAHDELIVWDYPSDEEFLATLQEMRALYPPPDTLYLPIPASCVRKVVGLKWIDEWEQKYGGSFIPTIVWPLPWPKE